MKIIVKNARMSFNDIFEPKSVNGGDPKYSMTLICSDDTKLKVKRADGTSVIVAHSKMIDIIENVLKEKFNKVPSKFKNWAYCKADGSLGAREEYTDKNGDFWGGFDAETFYISAGKRADKAPQGIQVLDQSREPIEASSGRIFSGCYVNCIIDLYAMDSKTGISVQNSLEGIQLVRSGKPLGIGQTDAASEFEDEEIAEVDEIAPTPEKDDFM